MAPAASLVTLLGPPKGRALAAAGTDAFTTSTPTTITGSSTHKLFPASTVAYPSDPLIDQMVSEFNNLQISLSSPPMGRTENNSATYLSSANPLVDFLFQVVPDTPPETVQDLLAAAWEQDPLMALKLVFNLRGVRRTGKSDREGFYAAALWIHRHHPKTLALNVPCVADFGYFKDLPEILHRLLYGVDARRMDKEKKKEQLKPSLVILYHSREQRYKTIWTKGVVTARINRRRKRRSATRAVRKEARSRMPRDERLAAETERIKLEQGKARQLRSNKRAEMAARALQRYSQDPDFRMLHESIADFLAEQLRADLEHLRCGNIRKIGLAAKWCPSLDSSYDRSTLLCESVARRVFPRTSHAEYEGVDDEHYAYRVRDRLRTEVLVPLRRVLELPEVYMSANRWGEIPYNRVCSVAMKNYSHRFKKHDRERFDEFLGRVQRGTAKIAAGAILPHDIVAQVMKTGEENAGDEVVQDCAYHAVAELQWQRMVNDLKEKGSLRGCIAVCDVSGSMEGTPMEVSVALGLLTSELCDEPWKGKVITFSETPRLHTIKGSTLREKVSFIQKMDWGGSTDFQAVFDRILRVAVRGGLKPEQMVKRVFVFSDMEFDEASMNPWETDYQAIQRKFEKTGFGSEVPEIVFWNLRNSRSTPVTFDQKGVALVSGFSKNLMTLFFDDDEGVTPEKVMLLAIDGEEYSKLAVYD